MLCGNNWSFGLFCACFDLLLIWFPWLKRMIMLSIVCAVLWPMICYLRRPVAISVGLLHWRRWTATTRCHSVKDWRPKVDIAAARHLKHFYTLVVSSLVSSPHNTSSDTPTPRYSSSSQLTINTTIHSLWWWGWRWWLCRVIWGRVLLDWVPTN